MMDVSVTDNRTQDEARSLYRKALQYMMYGVPRPFGHSTKLNADSHNNCGTATVQ